MRVKTAIMRIINLIEDTKGAGTCAYAHGLSFYVETVKHRLLMDLGPSEETIKNAELLGIDLSKVDTVILSHGHYDHSGGILPFVKINDKAPVYMQRTATKAYYADDGEEAGERFRYIGIGAETAKLPQVRFLNGNTRIDEELELFVLGGRKHEIPFTNSRLLIRTGDEYRKDDFRHEQYLIIRSEGREILMSGCAHNGILSIVEEYTVRNGKAPDLVVSGFHLMKKREYSGDEIGKIEDIARELKKYPTRYITCHCTGTIAFDVMKKILGDRLETVHSGEEIQI